MYLNKLNSEQKELFLDLSIMAAMADNHLAEEEKKTVKQYCAEMMISERFESRISEDEAIGRLKVCGRKEKRIIFTELLALILSDSFFDEKEREFVDKIAEIAEFSDDEKKRVIDLMKELYVVYDNLSGIIDS